MRAQPMSGLDTNTDPLTFPAQLSLALLLVVAIALGIVGAVVKGLFYLLIIGIVVFLAGLLLLGVRVGRRRGKRPAR